MRANRSRADNPTMVPRLRTYSDRYTNECVYAALWHEIILVTKGCHRGIYLSRYKGSHNNRWGSRTVFTFKF
jgi:hypothetical protein